MKFISSLALLTILFECTTAGTIKEDTSISNNSIVPEETNYVDVLNSNGEDSVEDSDNNEDLLVASDVEEISLSSDGGEEIVVSDTEEPIIGEPEPEDKPKIAPKINLTPVDFVFI